MVMGSPALQHPSCMAGPICLGMDQRGTVIVVTMRVRRVMAGLFVALAQERPIPSCRGRERTLVKESNASGLHAWGFLMLGEPGIFPDPRPSLSPSIECTDAPPRPLRQRPSV
jgi:hypothetical protein